MTVEEKTVVQELKLLGMGNPLVDAMIYSQDENDGSEEAVFVRETFANKALGVVPGGIMLAENDDAKIDAQLKQVVVDAFSKVSKDEHFVAGGATQNSIRVASWMGLSSPKYTGAVGKNGKDGEPCKRRIQMEKACTADGVVACYQESDKNQTGCCAVLVGGIERSLVTSLEAANDFPMLDTIMNDEKNSAKQAIEEANIIYSAGFFMTHPGGADAILKLTDTDGAVRTDDKIYCINLSAPFLFLPFLPFMQTFKKLFFGEATDGEGKVTKHAGLNEKAFIFGNETEAAEFAKAMEWKNEDKDLTVAEIAKKLHEESVGKPTVVFTQGADSTVVYGKDGLVEVQVKKMEKDLIKDTNGAGDAFVGGFLAALAKNETNVAVCCDAGHYAASQVIQRSGATVPTTQGWDEYVKQQ